MNDLFRLWRLESFGARAGAGARLLGTFRWYPRNPALRKSKVPGVLHKSHLRNNFSVRELTEAALVGSALSRHYLDGFHCSLDSKKLLKNSPRDDQRGALLGSGLNKIHCR